MKRTGFTRILIILLTIGILMTLMGCGKKEDPEVEDEYFDIVGAWALEEEPESVCVFDDNGIVTVYYDGEEAGTGVYSWDGSFGEIEIDEIVVYIYMDGEAFVIEVEDEEKHVLVETELVLSGDDEEYYDIVGAWALEEEPENIYVFDDNGVVTVYYDGEEEGTAVYSWDGSFGEIAGDEIVVLIYMEGETLVLEGEDGEEYILVETEFSDQEDTQSGEIDLSEVYDYEDGRVYIPYGDNCAIYPIEEAGAIIVGIGESATYFVEGDTNVYEVIDEYGEMRDRHFVISVKEDGIAPKERIERVEAFYREAYDDFSVTTIGPMEIAGQSGYGIRFKASMISKDGTARMAQTMYCALEADNGKSYVIILYMDADVTSEEEAQLLEMIDGLVFY